MGSSKFENPSSLVDKSYSYCIGNDGCLSCINVYFAMYPRVFVPSDKIEMITQSSFLGSLLNSCKIIAAFCITKVVLFFFVVFLLFCFCFFVVLLFFIFLFCFSLFCCCCCCLFVCLFVCFLCVVFFKCGCEIILAPITLQVKCVGGTTWSTL